MIIGRTAFYKAWKKSGSRFLKKRRYNKVIEKMEFPKDRPIKVLEVGCANGMDFIQFTDERFEITAVDINKNELPRTDVTFVQADAESLPFEDKSFDVVVSIGLLEHIEPMEKLCRVIKEFDRVGKHQVSIVPSISSFIEPHCGKIRFPFKIHRNMFSDQEGMPLHLNFFTEHTWTKFEGFHGAEVNRFYYLPPIIKNTIIYK